MVEKGYSDELQRALARADADELCRQVDSWAVYYDANWPEEYADDLGEILDSPRHDPDKALAYVMLAVERSDDAEFLAVVACSVLEDILHERVKGLCDGPSQGLLARVVDQARKSARFRWMLSHPFKVAISAEAWNAIEKFRITGPHEEPQPDTMPRRN